MLVPADISSILGGVGFDVAERMGLLPDINREDYTVREARVVGCDENRVAGFPADSGIFADVASLATKWNKPLSARLQQCTSCPSDLLDPYGEQTGSSHRCYVLKRGVPQNVPDASSRCAPIRAFSLLQQECFRAG